MNAIAYPNVAIGFKATEDDLVSVRYLEGGAVRQLTLGDFLDANIHEMSDEEVNALYAGDKVLVESSVNGPFTVAVVR